MNHCTIPVIWTYDMKVDSTNKTLRFKAALVGKGFMQIEDLHFRKFFSGFILQNSKDGSCLNDNIWVDTYVS